MDPETRAYLEEVRAEIRRLREEMPTREDLQAFATRDDFQAFATRDDLRAFATREDLQAFATRDDLRAFATRDDLQAFATRDDLRAFATREEMHASAAETRRHFDVVAESLRAELRTVAEGVAVNSERIEQVAAELRGEMDRRFGLVDLAFADVRRDIADLRDRP